MKFVSLFFMILAAPFLFPGFLLIGIGQVITGRIPHFSIFGYQVREARAMHESEIIAKASAEAAFFKRISDGVIKGEFQQSIRHEEIKTEEAPKAEESKAEEVKEEVKAKEPKKRVRRTKAEIQAEEAPKAEEVKEEVTENDF